MSRVLVFWVDGKPVPKARARTVRNAYGRAHTFTPKRTQVWEMRVALTARKACVAAGWQPDHARYALEIEVHRARRSGDGDNFLKAAKDAMNKIVWPDDRLVEDARVRLIDGQGEGMRVRVTRIEPAIVGPISEPNLTGAE